MSNFEKSEMKHIIIHAPPFWGKHSSCGSPNLIVIPYLLPGHNKALVALAVRIARARSNVIVSLITASAIYHNAVGEFEKKLDKEELGILRPRIK